MTGAYIRPGTDQSVVIQPVPADGSAEETAEDAPDAMGRSAGVGDREGAALGDDRAPGTDCFQGRRIGPVVREPAVACAQGRRRAEDSLERGERLRPGRPARGLRAWNRLSRR